MTALQVDLTKPDLTNQNFGACGPVAWTFGNSPDLKVIYAAEPDKVAVSALHFMTSPNCIDRFIRFDRGIILQASRTLPDTASTTNNNAGEVFGLMFDVSKLKPMKVVKIEVGFDYVSSTYDGLPREFWRIARWLRYVNIPIPVYRPGIGLGFRWIRIRLPFRKRPYFGSVSAFATENDLTAGSFIELPQTFCAGTFQTIHEPSGSVVKESMKINVPLSNIAPFSFVDFPFIEDFTCPIVKQTYPPGTEPHWTNNPTYSYKLELKLEELGGAVGVAITLSHTIDGVNYFYFGGVNALNTSKAQMIHVKSLSKIRFAGAGLVISRLTSPDVSYGPSYVRLTSLRVELDPVS